MSKYRLLYLDAENEINIVNENFPVQSVIECKKSIAELQRVLLSIDYYLIVKDNMFDLLYCIDNIDTHNLKLFATLNRYTFNFVNTFYSYINFYETNFKKVFYPIKTKYYDENIEYRLIYNIRNYMAHKEMVVTTVRTDITKNDSDDNVSVQLDIEKMADKDSGVQKKVREELQKMIKENKHLDLRLLTTNFIDLFELLQKDLMNELAKKIGKDLDTIDKVIVGCFPNYSLTYIENKENPAEMISLANFMDLFFSKLDKNYSIVEKYDKAQKRDVGFDIQKK